MLTPKNAKTAHGLGSARFAENSGVFTLYAAKLAFSGTHYLNQRSSSCSGCDLTDNGTFLPESY